MAQRIPSAVYRLQMHAGMGFSQAAPLVSYLRDLGISDLYSSPILQARRGSTHGYDVTDPTRVNPELGTEEEFETLARELQAQGMGVLLDIVPNHLAASSENPWWLDVLEDGPSSVYSAYFDIDWHPPSRFLDGRLLLPILGKPYADVLEASELALEFETGSFRIRYFDSWFPVATSSYRQILDLGFEALRTKLGLESSAFQELEGVRAAIERLPSRSAVLAEKAGERRLQRIAIKERLARLHSESEEIREFLDGNIRLFNGEPGVPESFTHLDRLLSAQPYALAYWRNTNQGINYRRFFTIVDLVGVRVEDPLTFDAVHSVILRLAAKKLVTGFRIDHIDGLRDPEGYLRRLQEQLAVNSNGANDSESIPFYVVVEKILDRDEVLPSWPVAGTTGYDFLNRLNGLFVDRRNMRQLDQVYHEFSDLKTPFKELVYEKKKEVMSNLLAVEMYSLGRDLSLLAENDRYARELPRSCLTEALIETVACFPVYRTYIRDSQPSAVDQQYIADAVDKAIRRNPRLDRDCFDFLREVLLLQSGPAVSAEQREARRNFAMRWQQFTGPIMAKGFEDSLLYVFNRLVSMNEVGGSPRFAGTSPREMHAFGAERQRQWPGALNATTTHDTKRSEDVRARINVLSEQPSEWRARLLRWHHLNQTHRLEVMGHPVPTPNEEVLIYQTLLGAWPLEESGLQGFPQRIEEYMTKAIREAMVHTRWTVPNRAHEEAVSQFIRAILDPSDSNEFLRDFKTFLPAVEFYGALNGLSQTLIKATFPGVPDFYQGSELWDLRLVDPDNRGPVDFSLRRSWLEELKNASASSGGALLDLMDHWRDGRIKLQVIRQALCFRMSHSELFSQGQYVPIAVTGSRKDHVFSFARCWQDRWAIVVIPRLVSALVRPGEFPLGSIWQDTALRLPRSAPANWRNIFDSRRGPSDLRPTSDLQVSKLLQTFPVALLEAV